MNAPRPDDLTSELLAGYADGELSAADRELVERWLAESPEARDLLDGQESLSPRNGEFWSAVRVPEPSAAQWANTLEGIRANRPAPARRRWVGLLGPLALLATAASLLFALPLADRPGVPAPLPAPSVVPAEDEEPFQMASADDVRIISMPEDAAGMLVVGDHPLRDPLLLARADEIEFHGVGSDVAGRFPEIPSTLAAEEAPMIWAPRAP